MNTVNANETEAANRRQAQVLLVDDDLADIQLTRRALKTCPVPIQTHIVHDGLEALEFIRRNGDHADAPKPDMVLLDLNMPRMDGREFLQAIREDEEFQSLPVILLTTSGTDRVSPGTGDWDADYCITKPDDPNGYAELIDSIVEIWSSQSDDPTSS